MNRDKNSIDPHNSVKSEKDLNIENNQKSRFKKNSQKIKMKEIPTPKNTFCFIFLIWIADANKSIPEFITVATR